MPAFLRNRRSQRAERTRRAERLGEIHGAAGYPESACPYSGGAYSMKPWYDMGYRAGKARAAESK